MSKKRALVVDDMQLNRSFIKSFLVVHNFDVDVAEDGLIGLNKAKESQYDLVFSDVEMPNMNGLEFLKSLKDLPNYRITPVIMLTTVDTPQVVDRAKMLGASYYMVKPFTEDKMREALGEIGINI